MKLMVLQENLNRGVSFVSRSVAARPNLPVLGNILLGTDEGRLKLTATNLETGVHFWVGAKIEKEGSITVPARIFSEFVSSLPKEKAEIEMVDNMLVVKCGAAEATFNVLSATEFPPVPRFPKEKLFSLEKQLFLEAINKVSFAAATDEGRPTLTGVLLEISEKEITFAATDGYRLSVYKTEKPKAFKADEKETRFLIPAKTLLEVGRSMGEGKFLAGGNTAVKTKKNTEEKEEDVLFAKLGTGNQAVFAFGDCQVVTQLVGGEYPAYQKIIPETFETKINIETEALTAAVRTAAIFARESANIVKLNIENEKLTVSANTPQVGTNKTTIEVKGKGSGEIAFNSRYLLDFLGAATGEEIVFETSGPLTPGVFRLAKEKGYLHIIMPVRVQK